MAHRSVYESRCLEITFDRLPKVCTSTGESASTIYRKISLRLFMPPVKLGPRTAGWPSHEVNAINAARTAGWADAQIRDLVNSLVEMRKSFAPQLLVQPEASAESDS